MLGNIWQSAVTPKLEHVLKPELPFICLHCQAIIKKDAVLQHKNWIPVLPTGGKKECSSIENRKVKIKVKKTVNEDKGKCKKTA